MLGLALAHPEAAVRDTQRVRQSHVQEMSASLAAEGLLVPSKRSSAAILTPPDEAPLFVWQPTASSSPSAHVVASSSTQLDDLVSSPTPRPRQLSIAGLDDSLDWLAPSVMAIASCVGNSGSYGGSLKVLSHALPAPSVPGHVYANIIDAIRAQCEPGQLAWINLMHAIPGRLNLAELPTSPPSTPAPPLDGDDYFTTQIFSSAVHTADDEAPGPIPRRAAERLLSPPGTVELAIIERYIPPCSLKETENMFSLERPSILVDRLVEIRPNGGCLTLIYPTRDGGFDFVADYVQPILDPLLRTMMGLHGLSMDFGRLVSDASTSHHLLDFAQLEAAVRHLCDRVSRPSDTALARRFHGIGSNFRVVYAEARHVPLDGRVWANWWARQQKPRLTAAISRYFQSGCKAPRDERSQNGVLLQEIIDGVTRRAAMAHAGATPGIEVGVLVIKRE